MKRRKIANLIIDSEINIDSIFTSKKKIYTFLNPVSYLIALKNLKIFNSFDGIFADGFFLTLAIRLFYCKKIPRRSFDMTSLAKLLFEYADHNAKSVYIVASKQCELELAVKKIKSKYSKINFIGYRNGYFNSELEIDEEIANIIHIKPDFLIVGMGILNQEIFLNKALSEGFSGIGFTCGGFIHQTSFDKVDYYPLWVDQYNIRFLYRFIKEKHTRIRYIQALFVFPLMFLREKLKF